MTLPDVNLLLYAYNEAATQHDSAAAGLQQLFSKPEPVLLSWTTILALIRVSTNRQVFPVPLEIEEAIVVVNDWFSQPNVVLIQPGERHWEILNDLIIKGQVRGPMVADAHLAALAIEHGATLHTTDRGFTRFPGLRVQNPLDSPQHP